MRWSVVRSLALAFTVSILAAGCGGGEEAGTTGTTPTAGASEPAAPPTPAPVALPGPVNDHGTKDVSGSDELRVEVDDVYFAPTYVKGSPGQRIELDVENEGVATHTFTAEALDVDEVLQAGDTRRVVVTLPSSGVVRFICRIHVSQGMQGAFFFTAGGTAPPSDAGEPPPETPGYRES